MASAQAVPAGADSIVLWDASLAAQAQAPPRAVLESAAPNARFATANQLPTELALHPSAVLVLPYGPVFPETAWPAIREFLDKGGNLVVLGGPAFTRPLSLESGRWIARAETSRYSRELLIDSFEATPGSAGLELEPNADVPSPSPPFAWRRAFSPMLHLSGSAVYPREGSTGSLDATLTTLLWGTKRGRRLAAPLLEIDHLHGPFAGGRWVLLSCEAEWNASSADLVRYAVRRAAAGAEQFQVRPASVLYRDAEPITLTLRWNGHPMPSSARAEVTIESESGEQETYPLAGAEVTLPARPRKGFYRVTARLWFGSELHALDRSGFWMHDEELLRSGPRISVGRDGFERDGQPYPVVGTTYMASDVQRQFFIAPNPYVWERDFQEIAGNGLNLVRSGWWSGWDQLADANGVPKESALCTLEAFLLSARRSNLPVQFTFFSFIPDQFGGENPYLDPAAVERQATFVSTVARRFKDVPWLSWDIINEPSFSDPKRLWVTRPNGDALEAAEWNRWLQRRHGSAAAAAAAWDVAPAPAAFPLPADDDFALPNIYRPAEPLKAHDYHLFAQEEFARWAATMRHAIRATGSIQPVTVGQDDGGGRDRPSPAFYSAATDFTTTHLWWTVDAILWAALVAQQPDKPMLLQEIGVNPDRQVEGSAWRTQAESAAVLERKLAVGLATGAGAVEWLYNVNAYMREKVEVGIGAKRVDGTEKPELDVLRGFAAFAAQHPSAFAGRQLPEVAIVTSQAYQYSVFNPFAIEAQRKAVRVLHQYAHVPAYVIAENRLAELGKPKLAILPSPQLLSDEARRRLLDYVAGGGQLLITGAVDRDPYWRKTGWLAALGIRAITEPVNLRAITLKLGQRSFLVSYDQEMQYHLERLRFADGRSMAVVAHGKGKIYLVSDPVELAEGLEATAAVYQEVVRRSGLRPLYTVRSLSPGLLVRPAAARDVVLYLLMNESAEAGRIDITDSRTAVTIAETLPAGRARLLLIDRAARKVIARCCD